MRHPRWTLTTEPWASKDELGGPPREPTAVSCRYALLGGAAPMRATRVYNPARKEAQKRCFAGASRSFSRTCAPPTTVLSGVPRHGSQFPGELVEDEVNEQLCEIDAS